MIRNATGEFLRKRCIGKVPKKLTWTNTKVPRGRNFKIEKVPLMKSYDGVLKET
ncbi:hypothetical protein HanIR_Chr16g0814711 [Helianthus annuus]|nr:hypothetical protein HanIR_Chr16g0814711 [Helianthus annuus]